MDGQETVTEEGRAEESCDVSLVDEIAMLMQDEPSTLECAVDDRAPDTPLILLDWDDTVLPTTYLTRLGVGLETEVPADLSDALEEYEWLVVKTLRDLQAIGKLVVVTNAEEGWVTMTVDKFLPGLRPILAETQCISARSLFEPRGYETPVEWKEETFAYVAQRHFGSDMHDRVVVSIGDSKHEREAVQRLSWRLGVVTKSVKLQIFPDLDILQREHEIFQAQIQSVFAHKGPMDIQVSV